MLNGNIHSARGQINDNDNKFGSKHHWIYNKLCIFHPTHVHQSLKSTRRNFPSTFSYLRFIDTSPTEQYDLFYSILARILQISFEIDQHHKRNYEVTWKERDRSKYLNNRDFYIRPLHTTRFNSTEKVWSELAFTKHSNCIYGYHDVKLNYTPETVEHRSIRMKNQTHSEDREFAHLPKPPIILPCQPCDIPTFLYSMCPPKVATPGRLSYAYSPVSVQQNYDHVQCSGKKGKDALKFGSLQIAKEFYDNEPSYRHCRLYPLEFGGILGTKPNHGWSNIVVPEKQALVTDAGKLFVLDKLLKRLKEEGHRVLIYSQMTKMIDLLEEFMWHRKHTFIRLDGSSKIHERRDMVADFQQRSDIFAFLLSTRAGGLGINLTAADTVIFYDSDWNPTVDLQAMDRAHRLGQTRQVTVYRLICKGTIEERILQRAEEKSEIQRMVIQGGSFKGLKQSELKPKEVVSLLLDDDEINRKVQAKITGSDSLTDGELNSSLKSNKAKNKAKRKLNDQNNENHKEGETVKNLELKEENSLTKRLKLEQDESSNYSYTEGFVDIEGEEEDKFENSCTSTLSNGKATENSRPTSPIFDFLGEKMGPKKPKRGTGAKRGRPPSSNKNSPLRATCSSGEEGIILSKPQHKINEKPHSFKQINRPMNQGDRLPKTNNRLMQGKSTTREVDQCLVPGQMKPLNFKKSLSRTSSSLEHSPSLTSASASLSPQSAYNDELGDS